MLEINKEKKKILYLMHIDWNWIKQRPQFIAESLSEHYKVDIFYVKNFKTKRLLVKDKRKEKGIFYFIKIPFSSKNSICRFLERKLNFRIINKTLKTNYDYVWITSPYILQFINLKNYQSSQIIYDCMDDHSAFSTNIKVNIEMNKQEDELLNRANIVFASSKKLIDKIKQKTKGNYFLINNAAKFQFPDEIYQKNNNFEFNCKNENLFNIVYFGTISNWFDFDIVLKILDFFTDIKFTIIGPADVTLPTHPRITYSGSIAHENMVAIAQKADAFIMPFKLNDLILSVDPVKVYEYIVFSKPIFLIKYTETEKFKEFAYLYSDLDELINYIKLAKNNLFNPKLNLRKEFIRQNTWKKRVGDMIFYLENL